MEIFIRNLREICKKKGPCKWTALSIGLYWGTWRGSFTGTFERKRERISGFPFCGPRGHLELSLGAIWNFSKEQGSTELISDYGAQRARYIRPRCIRTVRTRTQTPINQSINQSIPTQKHVANQSNTTGQNLENRQYFR